MAVKPITIQDFRGGLNLSTTSDIGDNQFSIAKNVFYNQKGQIQTRYGIQNFGNPTGTGKPISSYFFFQRDDNGQTLALCASSTKMFKYDDTTGDWNAIKTGLTEFETAAGKTSWKTRWDFAVYKNVVYLCNGVDNYASFTGAVTPAYMTGGTLATSVIATWQAVTNGTFNITIDGTLRSITGLNFSTDTTMILVAARIQAAIRAATGKLETCTWVTDHFLITSANKSVTSAVSVTAAQGTGTDISGVGATAFMDAETGRGTATAVSIGYAEYGTQPKYRYVNMTTDRLFGSGEDINPSTVYYTTAAPANGNTINGKAVVVGGDELGRINGMNELGNIMLVMKSGKIYSVDVTNEKAEPIDSQTGGFSDRTIAGVGNSLVYLTERGVDTLKPRTGVTGTTALESSPLDENVRELTTKIAELNLNANCAIYVKRLNNYYITFDSIGDDIPDTTLVYNALIKAWTQYTYPAIYDYGFYINPLGEYMYVAASATADQMYEIEVGFQDLGEDIEYEVKTKSFDFGEPGTYKTYDYIDIIGLKSKYYDIDINVEVDGVGVGGGKITDTMIIESKEKYTLGVRPIGDDVLTGTVPVDGIEVYQYVARVPLFVTGSSINFSLSSKGGTWTLDKARIGVNGEPIDVFGTANYV